MNTNELEVLTVGGGCFWCIEALFNEIKGVEKVVSGYMGGTVPGHPTYREVCSGRTGHAEVVQMSYDASILSFEALLVIFMTSHDPTTVNGQGSDRGTQYRSVIYYENSAQREIAQAVIKQMASYYDKPIVTELSKVQQFFAAEDYHQDYYANNKREAYCKAVILPKLAKLRKMHARNLKTVNT